MNEDLKVLRLTRVFDAPRDTVFQAWIDPSRLAEWWGPRHFTNPRCEIDPRPGGQIRIDMTAPDGTVYLMGGEVHEIVVPELLVFTSTALEEEEGLPWLEAFNTVTFEVDGEKVEARIVRATAAAAGALDGMEQGWTESLEKLSELAGSVDRELTIVRSFDSPRPAVWKAWTEPERITRWWGPNGFTTTVREMDVRPGGQWSLTMHGPDGRDYLNEILYREVVEPEKIVFQHTTYPFHVTTATFIDAGERTILAMRMVFESAELKANVVEEFGAEEGLKQTIGRLGDFLEEEA